MCLLLTRLLDREAIREVEADSTNYWLAIIRSGDVNKEAGGVGRSEIERGGGGQT